jgi:ABC-type branched-subunit amino acid transport system ATPase component
MISKVAIRNFKSLRDVHVDLERFTVFVGPNASGKSSILQALDLLCHAFRPANGMQPFGGVPMQGFGGAPGQGVEAELTQAVSRGSKDPVELAAEVGGGWYRYRTRSSSAPQNPPHIAQTKWDGEGAGSAPALDSKNWKQWKPDQGRNTPLPLSVLLRLEASKLVQPAPAQPDPTVMSPDGTGLHSALASMTLNDPDSWQALQENLKRIIPTIRRLRHTKAAQMHQPTSVLFDTVGADSLPATQVSEGTLLVLGLLAALHASGRPNLILLDDLDRGLHPKAQKELITLLRGLLDTNPDLQIVASTHSPYMLDCMGVNEVRMTFLKDDGATVCAALTSHPKYPKWKDEMTPGEMWSLFGEKWVAEEVTA